MRAETTPTATTPASRNAGSPQSRRRLRWLLVLVLVVAALFRLVALDHAPPGLHQDEAVNAWNAWCLLKTGTDQFGTPWPIFCIRAIGDYRSALFTYVMMPFLAAGGLNLWMIRLPAALSGLAAVLVMYVVGRRMFGTGTGLVAAALLALSPTHIQMSRLGLEASQTPLLTMLPLAALLWAGWPFNDENQAPRPARSLIAGLVTGACCYGYPAARLFIPVFLTMATAVTFTGWLRALHNPHGRRALASFALGVAVTFGPLAYQHITEPEIISRRGRTTWIWKDEPTTAGRLQLVAERYAERFDPLVLFASGDEDETFWTSPFGFLPRYMALPLVAGIIVAAARWRRSRAARVALVGVVLYPIADCMNWHVSLHGLRCSAGLPALTLAAALGLSAIGGALYRRRQHAWLLAGSVALVGMIVPEQWHFVRCYVHDRPKKMPAYYGTHMDLWAACQWLEPRRDEVDRVICFAAGPNPGYTPYLIPLIALEHDPARWFAEPRVVIAGDIWDRTKRYGRFHFLFGHEREVLLDQLRRDGIDERVVLFLRTDEPPPCEPTATIRGPDDRVTIVICDCIL